MLTLQVCIDDAGVYHGHTDGVTMYASQDGTQLWNLALPNSVLSGVQVQLNIQGFIGKFKRNTSKSHDNSFFIR